VTTFPDDTNDLRREIFASAKRLHDCRRELLRRQKAAEKLVREEFERALAMHVHGSCPERVWDNGDMTNCGEVGLHDGYCEQHKRD